MLEKEIDPKGWGRPVHHIAAIGIAVVFSTISRFFISNHIVFSILLGIGLGSLITGIIGFAMYNFIIRRNHARKKECKENKTDKQPRDCEDSNES